ncbi:Uncharacterized protein QTN25_001020 [Entamoeba marina]
MLIFLCILLVSSISTCTSVKYQINSPTFQRTHHSKYHHTYREVGCGEGRKKATWFMVENTTPKTIATSIQFYNHDRINRKGELHVTVVDSCSSHPKCINKYVGKDKLNVVTFTLQPHQMVYVSHYTKINNKLHNGNEWVRIRTIPKQTHNSVSLKKDSIDQTLEQSKHVMNHANKLLKDVRKEKAEHVSEKIANKMVNHHLNKNNINSNKRNQKSYSKHSTQSPPTKVEFIKKTRSVRLGAKKYRQSSPHFDELISFEDLPISRDICSKGKFRTTAKYYSVSIPPGKKLRVNTCSKETDKTVDVKIMIGDKCKEIKKYYCRRMSGVVVEYVPNNSKEEETVVVRVGSKNKKGYAFVKMDALDKKKSRISREQRFHFGNFWSKKLSNQSSHSIQSNTSNINRCKQCKMNDTSKNCVGCPVLVNNKSLNKNNSKQTNQKHIITVKKPTRINVNGNSSVNSTQSKSISTTKSTLTPSTSTKSNTNTPSNIISPIKINTTTIKAATVYPTTNQKSVLERFGLKGILIVLSGIALLVMALIFGMIIYRFTKKDVNNYNPF